MKLWSAAYLQTPCIEESNSIIPMRDQPLIQKAPACDLSVIVVSYNTVDMLRQCLSSLEKPEVETEIFVVDNASDDTSVQMVEEHFKNIHLIANADNLGFGKANNLAIARSAGRYLLFLNPDTIVTGGALKCAVDYMDAHPEIGMAGTKVINPDGSLQSSVEYRYPNQQYSKNDIENLPGTIAWVLGASIIARADVIKRLGGFDEDFFLYAEETDLCLRTRRLGWPIGYIEDSVIVHFGGQSERNLTPAHIWQKRIEADVLFCKKHYSLSSIRSIRRANRLHAAWRIFSLNLTLPFLRDRRSAQTKLQKYRLVFGHYGELNALWK